MIPLATSAKNHPGTKIEIVTLIWQQDTQGTKGNLKIIVQLAWRVEEIIKTRIKISAYLISHGQNGRFASRFNQHVHI